MIKNFKEHNSYINYKKQTIEEIESLIQRYITDIYDIELKGYEKDHDIPSNDYIWCVIDESPIDFNIIYILFYIPYNRKLIQIFKNVYPDIIKLLEKIQKLSIDIEEIENLDSYLEYLEFEEDSAEPFQIRCHLK
jgi:hypothetical protein